MVSTQKAATLSSKTPTIAIQMKWRRMTNTMNIMPLSPLHLEEEDNLESSDGSEGESRDEHLSMKKEFRQ